MAAPRSPSAESKPLDPPAAPPRDVPGGRCEPGQSGTSGQADKAEPNGGSSPGRGTSLRREDEHHPPVDSDDLLAALRWSGPSPQPGTLGRASREAWPDPSEASCILGQACSCPVWSGGKEPGSGGKGSSSVSSGRLSGSSGGHELCTPPPGLWKERPPQVLGPPRQLQRSDPRLERLRDKIRAQAAWQASCGSLGTTAPSSASRLCRASRPAPRKKVRKVAHIPAAQARPGFSVLRAAESQVEDKESPSQGCEPARVSQHQASVPREKTRRTKGCSCKREKAPKSPSPRRAPKGKDSEVAGVYAWRRGQALVRLLLGPPPKLPGHRSQAPWRELAPTVELGESKKIPAAEYGPDPTQMPGPACSDQQLSASTPSLASCDQPAAIQTAMAILQDLRRQIQAGLDLARHPQSRQGAELRRPKLGLQDQTDRRQQGPQSAPDTRGAFSKRPWAMTEEKSGPPERACSFPGQQPCSGSAKWESYPERTWAAKALDPSFQRPGSPPTRLGSSPQPTWSTIAGQGREDWGAPVHQPWSPLARPNPLAQRPWSTSFLQRPGARSKGRGSDLPPWRTPTGSFPEDAPGKENREELTAGQRPRGVPGPPHSSESLREFMRQNAVARRKEALEEKAAAERALELRRRRPQEVCRPQREAALGRPGPVVSPTSPGIVTFAPQEVCRPQREAALGRPAPVVSPTSPGIVTFAPRSAQPGGLDTPGSQGSPVLEWSKVTSGVVLGDKEAPGSFCLCLNKAFSRSKNREMEDSAPLLMSANASLHPWKLQDLPMSYPPQLCIYLDPKEAESLGMAHPLHFQYKQARLQALETTANILKQRIEVLTEKLHKPEVLDVLRDPALSLPQSLLPSPEPAAATLTAPAWPRAFGSSRELEALVSPRCQPDGEALPWSSGREWRQHASPWDRCTSTLQGFTGHGPSVLERRLARAAGSFCPLSPLAGRSHGMPATLDPPCGSLQLEEVLAARRASSGKPWTTWTCGGQGPGQLHLGDLRGGHLANIQQKSLSFLDSLKLDQQKQMRALALLQQRVEHEVSETQVALDGLLQPQLQRLMETQSTQPRPEMASELEWPQVFGDLEPQSTSAGPVREAGRPHRAPSQLPPARLDRWDNCRVQDSTDQGFGLQMLEQSLREEELRARHQAALLSLREKALEEKVRAELAWLEHQRGYLQGRRDEAALSALEEQKQHILVDLQQEQKEIRYLRSLNHSAHRERRLLLQHQRDLVAMQRCTAHLQQELQAWTTLPQSSGPEAQAARERGPETSPQPEGWAQTSSQPPTPHSPGSPPRSTRSSPSTHLLDEQASMTPLQAPSATDGHLPPLRPVWGEDTAAGDWVDSQGQPVESHSHTGQGDPQTEPSPSLAEEEAWTLTESRVRGWSQRSPGGDRPFGPQKTSVVEGSSSREGSELGLDVARSLTEEPHEMERRRSEAQRIETCRLEDPGVTSARLEATPLASSPGPGALQEEASSEGSPLPRLTAHLAGGPKSAPGTCSGLSSTSSSSSLSCPSLQEFQKASAVRVDVSDSSASLPDLELDTGLSRVGGLSIQASWEASGHLSSEPQAWPTWGLHCGEPWLGGVPGGRGLEGRRTSPWRGLSSEAAEAGSPELVQSWPQPLPDASRPRSGSELSEASSQIWEEDGGKDFLWFSPGAEPASGCPSPAEDLSDLGNGEAACMAPPPSLGAWEEQEASGASSSLSSGSNQGNSKQEPPEASHSDLDLSLSLSLGTSASEGADFSKEGETGPPPALAGCPEGPWDVIVAPLSPAGGPENRAPRCGGRPALAAPEEAHPLHACGVLTEILSPVDEVLSYSSAELPSSTHDEACLPSLLEQALPAKRGAEDASVCWEDFPSPPQEALCPEAVPDPAGEDTSMATDELPPWPETVPEALSPEPQKSGCPWGAGLCRSLEEGLGKRRSLAEKKGIGSQQSLCERAGNALGGLPWPSTQPPPPSLAPREDPSRPLVAGDREHLRHAPPGPSQEHGAPAVRAGSWGSAALTEASGSQSTPWGRRRSESTEGQGSPASSLGGLVEHLDTPLAKASAVGGHPREMLGGSRGAAVPPHPLAAAPAAPPTGPVPLLAGDWAGPHGHAGEEAERDLGCSEEDWPGAKDSVSRQPLLRRGADRDEAVDVVSTQLTRRILLDTLAVLSGLAQQSSPQMEGVPRGSDGQSPGSPQLTEQLLGTLGEAREL
ncbi:coiled-coil domain-containing protein 187 isoform X2 [Elephas maximus indicus]|uniref:coiled-coil domain-containing protein 187 isoform X2 n=1 Tax=Elephas maximus indicus TaxID=99487 RepID=UPI0021167B11|nr:coiled-coil domain-containing protein 187 isoform X2 [Elephas maximus indicus]